MIIASFVPIYIISSYCRSNMEFRETDKNRVEKYFLTGVSRFIKSNAFPAIKNPQHLAIKKVSDCD